MVAFFKMRVVGPVDEESTEDVALFSEPDDYELRPFTYHSSLSEVPRLRGYIRPRDRQTGSRIHLANQLIDSLC